MSTHTPGDDSLDLAQQQHHSVSPQTELASFSNKQIDTNTISTATLNKVALSPKYRSMNLISGFVFGIILAIVLTVATSGLFFDVEASFNKVIWAGYGLIFVITVSNMLYHFFADPLKQYALREHDLNYQSGLIFKSLISQPILRIQHIEIKRGPIERKFNLATLQVFSAGGYSYTFTIPGLEHESAVQLRQFVLDHKDLATDV